MVCTPVRSIVHSLKLVDYLSVQADNHALSFTYKETICASLSRPQYQDAKRYQVHYLNVCCVLHALVRFCPVDATADVQ